MVTSAKPNIVKRTLTARLRKNLQQLSKSVAAYSWSASFLQAMNIRLSYRSVHIYDSMRLRNTTGASVGGKSQRRPIHQIFEPFTASDDDVTVFGADNIRGRWYRLTTKEESGKDIRLFPLYWGLAEGLTFIIIDSLNTVHPRGP